MKTGTLRVGIVGGGRIADLSCLGWIEHPNAEIAAICDVDEEIRTRRAAEWGCAAYATLEECLADDSVDAIEILTPHHLHGSQAIAALRAGRHVSLQKPPTLTMEEFDEVAAVADEAATRGVRFGVYENFMFYPPHQLALRLVAEGEIGDVLSIRIVTAGGRVGAGQGWHVPSETNAWRMQPDLCGGGMLTFDHGYHCFQLGRLFIDDPVEVVHAFINVIELGPDAQIDAPAMITWRYSGRPRFGSWEVIPSMDLDVMSKYYVSDDRVELRGTRGILWVNRCSGQLLEEPPVVLYKEGEVRQFHRVESDWAVSFRNATTHFIDAVLRGTPLQHDARDARETLAFALAAQRSAAEGREVAISEFGP